jgi:hypothetical protein
VTTHWDYDPGYSPGELANRNPGGHLALSLLLLHNREVNQLRHFLKPVRRAFQGHDQVTFLERADLSTACPDRPSSHGRFSTLQ